MESGNCQSQYWPARVETVGFLHDDVSLLSFVSHSLIWKTATFVSV